MLADTLAQKLIDLFFMNATFANVGDVTGLVGSTTAGNFYFSLHTAYPGQAGAQNTSEASYTNYARQAVARSTSGWTRTGRVLTNDNAIEFPAAGNVSPEVITHWALGTASSGAGQLCMSGHIKRASGSPLVGTGLADDTVTIPGHGFSVGDKVGILQVAGQTLPTGLTDGATYYIKTVSGDVVTLSATSGGSTLNITAAGVAWFIPALTISAVEPIQPRLAAGAVSIRF